MSDDEPVDILPALREECNSQCTGPFKAYTVRARMPAGAPLGAPRMLGTARPAFASARERSRSRSRPWRK